MAHEPDPLIGIDLGTTNSVVSYIDPHGRPICLPNAEGDLITPSVVFFEEDGPAIVGKEAIKAGMERPQLVAEAVKRDMGKEVYHRPIRGKYLPPAAISGVILHRLVEDAAARTGPFRRAVVTVPAYFNDPRRGATIDAARMAGLKEVELLNEPTAAALACGYEMGIFTDEGTIANTDTKRPGQFTLLVYDLGGGTFDATLMKIQDRHFRAVVCDGDVQLGGRDWDERIVNYAVECFEREYKTDPRSDPETMQAIWYAAEEAKKTLSLRSKAVMKIQHAEHKLAIELSREDLHKLTEDLLGRTRLTCELVMMEANMQWEHLDALLLVGGATRMPMVGDMIAELSGIEPSRTVSPDEAVSQGAALYAQMLWGEQGTGKLKEQIRKKSGGARITNVNTHSLGIVGRKRSSGKRRVSVLIPRNTEIPHSNSKTFRTRNKGQQKIYIPIVEGESDDPEECALIGECRIVDLPPDLPEHWPVTVTFAYRRDGGIVVEAQVKDAVPFHVQIDRDMKISTEEAESWANELIGDWDEESAAAEQVELESTLPPSRVKTAHFKPKDDSPTSPSDPD